MATVRTQQGLEGFGLPIRIERFSDLSLISRGPEARPANRRGALVLCGGKGTRILDVTGDLIPKPLVHIGGKPLIHYSVNELDSDLIKTVLFVTGHHGKQIMEWAAGERLSNAEVIELRSPHGTIAQRIVEAVQRFDMNPIVLCNGDEIRHNFSLPEAIAWHERTGAIATTIATSPANIIGPSIAYKVGGVDFLVEDSGRQQVLTPERIAEGWLQHAGILIINREAVRHLEPDIDDGYEAIHAPLIRAGVLTAFVDTNVQYSNVNSKAEADLAEQQLKAARRLDRIETLRPVD